MNRIWSRAVWRISTVRRIVTIRVIGEIGWVDTLLSCIPEPCCCFVYHALSLLHAKGVPRRLWLLLDCTLHCGRGYRKQSWDLMSKASRPRQVRASYNVQHRSFLSLLKRQVADQTNDLLGHHLQNSFSTSHHGLSRETFRGLQSFGFCM